MTNDKLMDLAKKVATKIAICEICNGMSEIRYKGPDGEVEHIRKCKACDAQGVRKDSVKIVYHAFLQARDIKGEPS